MINSVEMAEQLKGQYREVFEKADLYGTLNGLEPEVLEDKLMNLYDLLIEAQHEEKPVDKIIGQSIEEFCKEYFDDYEKEEWWKLLPKKFFKVARILFVLELLDWLILNDQDADLFTMTSDMTPFVFGFIFGFVMDTILGVVVKPLIFKNKIKPHVYYLAITVVWLGCIFGGVILLSDYKLPIPIFPIMLISGVYVVIYLAVTFIQRYQKSGRITDVDKAEKKAEKQVKKEFKQEVSDKYLESASASGMAWRFKRLNKKKLRKGKGELTQEEFAEKVRKEQEKVVGSTKWVILFFAAVIIGLTVCEMINNCVTEGLIFGAILLVIEVPICIFFVKGDAQNARAQLSVLQQCEEQGLTVVEYYEMLKGEK